MKQGVKRIRIISIFLLTISLFIVVKLYFLQIIKHKDFVLYADKQYSRPNNLIFNRGNIFFETKDKSLISAGTLKSGFIVALNPKILANIEDTYEKINNIFPIDKEEFLLKANKKDDPYEEIAKRVPENLGKQIDDLKIKGVRIYKEQWRFYPGGNSASHEIGFLAFKDNELAGRYGLERFYESTLTRKDSDLYANFFIEIFSNLKKTVVNDNSMEGDIISTIEPTAQAHLEEIINKVQNKWSSAETGGIVIDPNTGEIIAMTSVPSFDINNFQKEKNVKVFSNPLVEEVREMGSIIKPLTVAAGIDAGVISADTKYMDNGSITLNTKTIYNYDKKARGQITIQTALSKSLNTGMVYVMQKLGKEKFAKYMFDFGLGEKTNIDLPNEGQNIVSNLKSPREIEYATASFGQGVALSPISTVSALSVLANGGVRITPHLVKRINYRTGLFKNINPDPGKRVIKKETSEEISRMLVRVVDESLLDGKAKNLHFSVAAKTGTAQISNPTNGGYYDDRFLHSFFGYFPAFKPRFLVFLYTVYPKGVDFAANTLALPFLDMSKFLLNYYEIPPDR